MGPTKQNNPAFLKPVSQTLGLAPQTTTREWAWVKGVLGGEGVCNAMQAGCRRLGERERDSDMSGMGREVEGGDIQDDVKEALS